MTLKAAGSNAFVYIYIYVSSTLWEVKRKYSKWPTETYCLSAYEPRKRNSSYCPLLVRGRNIFNCNFSDAYFEIHWLLMQLSTNYWFGGGLVCALTVLGRRSRVFVLWNSVKEKSLSSLIQFNSDASCFLQSLQPMLSFLSLKPARGSKSAVFTNKTKLPRVTLLWKVPWTKSFYSNKVTWPKWGSFSNWAALDSS